MESKSKSSGVLTSGCLDLGVSKPDGYGTVANALAKEEINFVVLLEEREPDFFLKYDRYNPESYVRLNRCGPHNSDYYPNQGDLKSFVKAFHNFGIEISYGFWVHGNRWIDLRHPELLLTDSSGAKLRNDRFDYDFNPLLILKKDSDYGIAEGEPFVSYVCRQYSKLADDFGFDGLFIGDGGMGFRLFGDDSVGVNTYDFSNSSILCFLESKQYRDDVDNNHDCILGKEIGDIDMTRSIIASHIWSFHQKKWIEWNCAQWSNLYYTLASFLHAKGKHKLGAFNCMNYGPEEALIHGVDYKAIAKSGLDYLIFQTYDYAWATYFKLHNKDIKNNLEQLISLNNYLSSLKSKPKILFTAETSDSIEGWNCPLPRTLEQVRAYSTLVDSSSCNFEQGSATRPLTDGFFIVWLNEVPSEHISKMRENFGTCHKASTALSSRNTLNNDVPNG